MEVDVIMRPAPQTDGKYMVSSQGEMFAILDDGALKPIKGVPNMWGYLMVGIDRVKRGKKVRVHRLVCEAFNGPPPQGMNEVAHINGIPHDNRASNLRWTSRKQNEADKVRHGTKASGSRHGSAKLTPNEVLEIREDKISTHESLARKFRVSMQAISDIRNFKTWRSV